MALIQIKRGNRAQIEAAASFGALQTGEPYHIVDENRIALGISGDSFVTFPNLEDLGYRGALVGSIVAYAGATAPGGYLLCNGQTVSRSTYAALFAVTGDTYGPGDGTTTFAVPDLRDRTALGASGTRALGSSGGSASVTLVRGQIPPMLVDTSGTGTLNATAGAENWLSGGSGGPGAAGIWKSAAPSSSIAYLGNDTTVDPINITPSHVALNYLIYTGV